MPTSPLLLLVDDDPTFCQVLARALSRRGIKVRIAHGVDVARQSFDEARPDYAIVDLCLPDGSGLELIRYFKVHFPAVRILVLTGYASIATAVEAIKLGAMHYLAKPVDADEIMAGFGREAGNPALPVPAKPLSVGRLEWEHIQKVLLEQGGNVSAAARALGMHRRTLQRKLFKRPVRE